MNDRQRACVRAGLWIALEWAWTSTPMTPLSSSVMLSSHLLILLGIWTRASEPLPEDTIASRARKRHEDLND